MDLVFNGYAFQHICKFLLPIDIVNMCHIYPHQWTKLYYVFKKSIANNIDDFFKSYFGNHYNEFREEMIKNKAIISGSFILQTILNEKWAFSDIDIYIPIKGLDLQTAIALDSKKTTLEDFFYFTTNHLCPGYQTGYQTGPATQIQYIRDYIKMDAETAKELDGIDITTQDYLTKKHMLDVTNISKMKESLRLQTILIDIEPNFNTLVDYIKDSFDLNICKNAFYYDVDGCHLYIRKASQIIDKKTNFCFNPTCSEPLKRYKKYKERGFTFIEDKQIIFNMIVDKSLCMDYNIDRLNKRFRLFEVKFINNIETISHFKHEKFEIIKSLSNDIFPIYENKTNGTYFDGSVFVFDPLNKIDCHGSCPINVFLGSDIKHFHTHGLSGHRVFLENFNIENIFIYKKNEI